MEVGNNGVGSTGGGVVNTNTSGGGGGKYVTYSNDVSVSKTDEEDEDEVGVGGGGGGVSSTLPHGSLALAQQQIQSGQMPPDSAVLENFAELVAAFERSVSKMSRQLNMQLASPKLPKRHYSTCHGKATLSHAQSANWYGSSGRDFLDGSEDSANAQQGFGGSQGSLWDTFGSLPKRSQSQRNPLTRTAQGDEYGDSSAYGTYSESVGTNHRRKQSSSGAGHYGHGSSQQSGHYTQGTSSLSRSTTGHHSHHHHPEYTSHYSSTHATSSAAPPPPPPRKPMREEAKKQATPPVVGNPRNENPYHVGEPTGAGAGVKSKSKISLWLPVKLVRRRKSKTWQRSPSSPQPSPVATTPTATTPQGSNVNKSGSGHQGQGTRQRSRSSSPGSPTGCTGGGGGGVGKKFSVALREVLYGTQLQSQSTLNRRGQHQQQSSGASGGVGADVSYSLGDLAKMLKDAERQIARLKKEQYLMSHNFEGSRKDVLALQAENEKLKRNYQVLQNEMQSLKITTTTAASTITPSATLPSFTNKNNNNNNNININTSTNNRRTQSSVTMTPRLQSSPQLNQVTTADPSSTVVPGSATGNRKCTVLSREASDSYEAHLESPIARSGHHNQTKDFSRAGTPYSLANHTYSSRDVDVLDNSSYSMDGCLTPPTPCRVIQVLLTSRAAGLPLDSTSDQMADGQGSTLLMLSDDFDIKPDLGWEELDRKLELLFEAMMHKIDPKDSLGLNFYPDVHSYSIGEIERSLPQSNGKRVSDPSILPYGYCIGPHNQIILKLNPHSSAQLALDTCVNKQLLDVYISLLTKHRKIVIMGPPCTGKKFLSRCLAQYAALHAVGISVGGSGAGKSGSDRDRVGSNMVVLDALEESEASFKSKMQKHFIRTSQEAPNETSLNNSRKSATSIGIILNLQSTTVANTLNTLNSSRCTLDYVIATMETGNSDMENFRLYKNFRWINLNTGKEPVDGILSRVVHKRLLEDRNQRENLDEKHVIKLWVWMEQFSKKIMQLVVKLGLQNVIRTGPSSFIDCPLVSENLRLWVCNYWNKDVLPHVKLDSELVQNDPEVKEIIDWVYQSFPWNLSDNQLVPLFHRSTEFDFSADLGNLLSSFSANNSLENAASIANTLTPGADTVDAFDVLVDEIEGEILDQSQSSAPFLEGSSSHRARRPNRLGKKTFTFKSHNGNQGSEHESFSTEEF